MERMQSRTSKDTEEARKSILRVIDAIIESELKTARADDSTDGRRAILNVFEATAGSNYSHAGIITRLIIIDSIYATNAGYSYYSFEEMADKILSIGKEDDAIRYFQSLSRLKTDRLKSSKGYDTNTLFDEPYGIQKNLSNGAKQISLLSKYAYYQLLEVQNDGLGFSIYDRLANEAFPIVCDMLSLNKEQYEPAKNISSHIQAFDMLRRAIFDDKNERYKGYQQFDLLDAYLWRMGKFSEGNVPSLDRKDYEQFISNLKLVANKENEQWETATAYKRRLATEERFAMLTKTKTTTRKNGESVSYGEVEINTAILHLLKNEDGKSIFKGLQAKEYMITLHEHWKTYFC